MDNSPPADTGEGVPLFEGWMLGVIFFPQAMAKVLRLPPANDDAPREV